MSVTYGEALGDRDVRPDRCWRKRPLEGEAGVQHGLRTRGRDLRIDRNHVQILPGSSDDMNVYKCMTGVLQYGRPGEPRAQNWKYRNSSRCHMPNSEIASASAVRSAHAAFGRHRSKAACS